ncbi:Helix-turn-helix domain protein [compost metagenome]
MVDKKIGMNFIEELAREVAGIILPDVIDAIRSSSTFKEDRTLELDEAADYIGVSKATLYRLCNEKSIPHFRLGSKGTRRPRISFSSNSLDEWKKENEKSNYER